ncbi:hypothetical protein SUGI_0424590 [Cryptomeria japonica]|nr:hypothetical protein SUGI_0424590 [Cryptomeria japonica]
MWWIEGSLLVNILLCRIVWDVLFRIDGAFPLRYTFQDRIKRRPAKPIENSWMNESFSMTRELGAIDLYAMSSVRLEHLNAAPVCPGVYIFNFSISNSKKTDKASILDETIEYVKQLQLLIQMLCSPNKMSPSYICVPMGNPCFQVPQMCMNTKMGSQWSNGCMTVHQGVQAQPGLWFNEGNKECFHRVGLPMFTKVSQRINV